MTNSMPWDTIIIIAIAIFIATTVFPFLLTLVFAALGGIILLFEAIAKALFHKDKLPENPWEIGE